MIGSIYGEGIYSAGLYSWEAGWALVACDPLTGHPGYIQPPSVVWPGIACQPLTTRSGYVVPPPASWSSVTCDPLTVR